MIVGLVGRGVVWETGEGGVKGGGRKNNAEGK